MLKKYIHMFKVIKNMIKHYLKICKYEDPANMAFLFVSGNNPKMDRAIKQMASDMKNNPEMKKLAKNSSDAATFWLLQHSDFWYHYPMAD